MLATTIIISGGKRSRSGVVADSSLSVQIADISLLQEFASKVIIKLALVYEDMRIFPRVLALPRK